MSKNKTLTYEMIRAFTETFDGQDSDGYILQILNGEIDIKKMKSFILDNFVGDWVDNPDDDEIKGHLEKDNCQEIYKKGGIHHERY